MVTPKNNHVFVVVPNWNGADKLATCLDSLLAQSHTATIVVVENGSTDGSAQVLEKYPDVVVLPQLKNLGFAGGVNVGFRYAIEQGAELVAAFNNDAIADKNWLQNLVKTMQSDNKVGIVTGKLLNSAGDRLDSTGEFYTTWGLPYPRGRGEDNLDKYDHQTEIFAASGGASLYRVKMLEQIGLFDEKFFAYYEDVDLSFRAQLAGWKITYVPTALAYHQIGATTSKIKGFTTYQTMKNLPLLLRKNLPLSLGLKVGLRFWLAYLSFFASAVARGQFWPAFKGLMMTFGLLPHTLKERRKIQKNRQVSVDYINEILVHDLPPAAERLRNLRARWWKLRGKV